MQPSGHNPQRESRCYFSTSSWMAGGHTDESYSGVICWTKPYIYLNLYVSNKLHTACIMETTSLFLFLNRTDWSIASIAIKEFHRNSWFGHMRCVIYCCQITNHKFCANEILSYNLFLISFHEHMMFTCVETSARENVHYCSTRGINMK